MKANIKEIHEHFFGLDRHTLTMAGEEASIRLERGLRQSNNDNDNDNDDDNDDDNDNDNDDDNDQVAPWSTRCWSSPPPSSPRL